jgi:O-antigen/teichoic acid export membrane protein
MMSLVASGMTVLTPRFALLEGRQDHQEMKRLFLLSLKVSATLSFGCCLGAFLFGKQVIFFWVGPEFGASVLVLWILAGSFSIALAQTPGIGLMYALNKHKWYALVTILEGFANLALSIYLARRLGLVGVALGTAIPMVIVKLFVQPVYVSRIVSIKLYEYVRAILPSFSLAAILLVAGWGLGITSADFPMSLYLFLVGLGFCLVYLLVLSFAATIELGWLPAVKARDMLSARISKH